MFTCPFEFQPTSWLQTVVTCCGYLVGWLALWVWDTAKASIHEFQLSPHDPACLQIVPSIFEVLAPPQIHPTSFFRVGRPTLRILRRRPCEGHVSPGAVPDVLPSLDVEEDTFRDPIRTLWLFSFGACCHSRGQEQIERFKVLTSSGFVGRSSCSRRSDPMIGILKDQAESLSEVDRHLSLECVIKENFKKNWSLKHDSMHSIGEVCGTAYEQAFPEQPLKRVRELPNAHFEACLHSQGLPRLNFVITYF